MRGATRATSVSLVESVHSTEYGTAKSDTAHQLTGLCHPASRVCSFASPRHQCGGCQPRLRLTVASCCIMTHFPRPSKARNNLAVEASSWLTGDTLIETWGEFACRPSPTLFVDVVCCVLQGILYVGIQQPTSIWSL